MAAASTAAARPSMGLSTPSAAAPTSSKAVQAIARRSASLRADRSDPSSRRQSDDELVAVERLGRSEVEDGEPQGRRRAGDRDERLLAAARVSAFESRRRADPSERDGDRRRPRSRRGLDVAELVDEERARPAHGADERRGCDRNPRGRALARNSVAGGQAPHAGSSSEDARLTAFVDTNVLIRHLTGDPPGQARRATAFLAGAEELLLPDLIVAEAVYVLESFYEVERERVAELVRAIIGFPAMVP
jgi:hypothetical protein